MFLRRVLQRCLDYVQFWFDIATGQLYQPLPWVGIRNARRSDGTHQRWSTIYADMCGRNIRTAVDVGCQAGFFCFALADVGVQTMGIDFEERPLRVARFTAKKRARKRPGAFTTTSFAQMEVTTENTDLLPHSDLTLYLSVWHHSVRMLGIDSATEILRKVWQHTNKVLYFETGESEITPNYHLPDMGPMPEKWIADYLRSTCNDGNVQLIGQSKAFSPGGNNHRRVAERHIFRVERITEVTSPDQVDLSTACMPAQS